MIKYHPKFWADGSYQCCRQTEKLAPGCEKYNLFESSKYSSSMIVVRMTLLLIWWEREVVSLITSHSLAWWKHTVGMSYKNDDIWLAVGPTHGIKSSVLGSF